MNYRQQRFLRQLLYQLKRNYGDKVFIYRNDGLSTNIETGVRTVNKTIYEIDRAILLPAKMGRETQMGISEISANKKFMYGLSYDASVRTIIFDGRDLPADFVFDKDDWLVYEGRRYNIKSTTEFEQFAGWMVVAKHDPGSKAEQVLSMRVENYLGVSDESSTT